MPAYEFLTVDVFTAERFGGNPLAVFPAAAGLTAAQMQNLAREFNLSEITFVLPPADPAHTAHVRIFTPVREVPFAGHPNVGTAFVLARLQPNLPLALVFEEAAGLVPIELQRDSSGLTTGAKITAPQALAVGQEIAPEIVADCVGLAPEEVTAQLHVPVLAGVGMKFVIAELTSLAALARARPDLAAFRAAAERFPDIGVGFKTHLYVRDPSDPTRLSTRMFAPLLGIMEDPATGSANAALAALLARLTGAGRQQLNFDIRQGVEMGRPSRLHATAYVSGQEIRASVAGSCVPVLRGHAEV
jgi:trans-2,3-dihydro-3-hydroxyanthranilate isomerase